MILIDIMMLIIFAYIKLQDTAIDSKFYVDYSKGFAEGTRFSLKDERHNTIKNFKMEYGKLIEIEQEDIGSYFNSMRCGKGSKCSKKIAYSGDYYYAKIYFPDKVMVKAYSLLNVYCKQFNCDGNIYINSGHDEAFICSRDKKRFVYINSFQGKLEIAEKCSPKS